MFESNKLSAEVKALFKLDRRTIVELAKLIGMRRNNLVDALGNRRGVPSEYQAKLLEVVGLLNHQLNPHKIHYWQVGYQLDYFITAFRALFPYGAEVAGLCKSGEVTFDLSQARDKQLYAIYDDNAVVIVIRKAIGLYAPLAQTISPETVPTLRWKGGSMGSHNIVSMSPEILKLIECAEYQDINQLRVLLGQSQKLKWHEVFEYVRQRWSSPDIAMEAILNINTKK
jgi:hypothetical protein